MKKILFIQGGGIGGYEADKKLVNSLQNALGNEYIIHYPEITSTDSEPDFGWIRQIEDKISDRETDFILVGHSFGASMILKYLCENPSDPKLKGIFLIASPFWSGNEDWKQGLKLKENFADLLPKNLPLFFYHCKDDEEISFSQFNIYKEKIKKAIFREIENGGHQLNNDLSIVAKDIRQI